MNFLRLNVWIYANYQDKMKQNEHKQHYSAGGSKEQ